MTQTTPTRDEAVPTGWKLVPIEPTEEMRRAGYSANAIKNWGTGEFHHHGANEAWAAMLASAPAPASGRVDAVARRAKYLLNRLETDDGLGIGEIDTMLRMAASLSPAATPVSEAEPVAAVVAEELALKIVSLSVNWLREDGTDREHDDYVRANWTKEIAEAKRLILAALAKPAPSPAPVRPIGNQGISDYQREIARNMAEGFAAWNAARQEALPSDEPASSPAGGEVRRVRHKKRGTTYRVLHGAVMQSTHWRDTHYKVPADGRTVVVYQSEDDGSVWVRPAEEFEDGRFEALSQSASAGRGDGDAGS